MFDQAKKRSFHLQYHGYFISGNGLSMAEGIDKKIWDSKHKPTSLALNEYKDAIKRYKLLRDEGMQEFRIWDEKDNIYIPETFRGVK